MARRPDPLRPARSAMDSALVFVAAAMAADADHLDRLLDALDVSDRLFDRPVLHPVNGAP